MATVRLADAQLERTWAIAFAHEQGLSIRQIASATDVSATRVHQLLATPDARDIPQWLNYLPYAKEMAQTNLLTRRMGSLNDRKSPW